MDGLREEIRKLGVMNHVRGRVGTYPLLSVYIILGSLEGEELLATKSDALGLGGFGVTECSDDCLLLLRTELYREIVTRERLGMVQAATLGVLYFIPRAGCPNASSQAQDCGPVNFSSFEEVIIDVSWKLDQAPSEE